MIRSLQIIAGLLVIFACGYFALDRIGTGALEQSEHARVRNDARWNAASAARSFDRTRVELRALARVTASELVDGGGLALSNPTEIAAAKARLTSLVEQTGGLGEAALLDQEAVVRLDAKGEQGSGQYARIDAVRDALKGTETTRVMAGEPPQLISAAPYWLDGRVAGVVVVSRPIEARLLGSWLSGPSKDAHLFLTVDSKILAATLAGQTPELSGEVTTIGKTTYRVADETIVDDAGRTMHLAAVAPLDFTNIEQVRTSLRLLMAIVVAASSILVLVVGSIGRPQLAEASEEDDRAPVDSEDEDVDLAPSFGSRARSIGQEDSAALSVGAASSFPAPARSPERPASIAEPQSELEPTRRAEPRPSEAAWPFDAARPVESPLKPEPAKLADPVVPAPVAFPIDETRPAPAARVDAPSASHASHASHASGLKPPEDGFEDLLMPKGMQEDLVMPKHPDEKPSPREPLRREEPAKPTRKDNPLATALEAPLAPLAAAPKPAEMKPFAPPPLRAAEPAGFPLPSLSNGLGGSLGTSPLPPLVSPDGAVIGLPPSRPVLPNLAGPLGVPLPSLSHSGLSPANFSGAPIPASTSNLDGGFKGATPWPDPSVSVTYGRGMSPPPGGGRPAPARPVSAPEAEDRRDSMLPVDVGSWSPPPPDPMAQSPQAAPMASVLPFDEAHYRSVYNDFVSSKRKLSEKVDNITYEGFKAKLRDSEQKLIDKHGCRAVRFQVMVNKRQVSLRPQLVR